MNLMTIISDILTASWAIFNESAIYMLFGFVIAGWLHAGFTTETIARYLNHGKIKSVIYAAFLGIPLPICSCGVVPAAAALRKKGAGKGATLSFLISTPETGVDSIAVTYALTDIVLTVIRPVSAFVTASVAGIVENMLPPEKKPENPIPGAATLSRGACGCGGRCSASAGRNEADNKEIKKKTMAEKAKDALHYLYDDLLEDIAKWFVIGVLLAGVLTALVPDAWIARVSSSHAYSMLLMLVMGVPLYVCATSSTPIAAALIAKGLNPGAALVFLLTGPATNMVTLSMVTGLLGKRSTAVYLSSIIICSLLLGVMTDYLYAFTGISAKATAFEAKEFMPEIVKSAAAALLAALLLLKLIKPLSARFMKMIGQNG